MYSSLEIVHTDTQDCSSSSYFASRLFEIKLSVAYALRSCFGACSSRGPVVEWFQSIQPDKEISILLQKLYITSFVIYTRRY